MFNNRHQRHFSTIHRFCISVHMKKMHFILLYQYLLHFERDKRFDYPRLIMHISEQHWLQNQQIDDCYQIKQQQVFSGHHYHHMDQKLRFSFCRLDPDVWVQQHTQIIERSTQQLQFQNQQQQYVYSHYLILTVPSFLNFLINNDFLTIFYKIQYIQINQLFIPMSFSREPAFKPRGYHDQNKNQFAHNKIKQNYADEVDFTQTKNSDSSEIKQLKNKMTLIMNKLTTVKKEKEQVMKQNKLLQEEVITMQTNLRQMIPGFSNTSSSFPIHNQLVVKIAEFYKYDCLDKFFDLLCPELSMKGILFFYSFCFNKLNELINNYMNPALNSLMKVGCFNTLEGPIMNVLRKSFQVNQQKIYKQIFLKQNLANIIRQMQSTVNLQNSCSDVNQQLHNFLMRLGEILLYCYISDPPLNFDLNSIGKKVLFNPLKHDPFDGFIKAKQQCWIILPEVRKGLENGEMIAKSLVLHTNYDITN